MARSIDDLVRLAGRVQIVSEDRQDIDRALAFLGDVAHLRNLVKVAQQSTYTDYEDFKKYAAQWFGGKEDKVDSTMARLQLKFEQLAQGAEQVMQDNPIFKEHVAELEKLEIKYPVRAKQRNALEQIKDAMKSQPRGLN